MAQREYELGDAELEILTVLWDGGPSTVRDVLARLHERDRRVAYTTVQTVLTRLEQKKVVVADKSSQAFVYRPTVTRERFSRFRLKALVDQLYNGAVGPLVLQLVRSKRLRPEEIQELQKLIERLDQDSD